MIFSRDSGAAHKQVNNISFNNSYLSFSFYQRVKLNFSGLGKNTGSFDRVSQGYTVVTVDIGQTGRS